MNYEDYILSKMSRYSVSLKQKGGIIVSKILTYLRAMNVEAYEKNRLLMYQNFIRFYNIAIVFSMLFLSIIMCIWRVPCATGTMNNLKKKKQLAQKPRQKK